MTDLENLIRAVEAGEEPGSIPFFTAKGPLDGAEWGLTAWSAYTGSLDAAQQLHAALLPGWIWGRQVNGSMFVARRPHMIRVQTGVYMDPARAWLLAILRAVAATTDAREGV